MRLIVVLSLRRPQLEEAGRIEPLLTKSANIPLDSRTWSLPFRPLATLTWDEYAVSDS